MQTAAVLQRRWEDGRISTLSEVVLEDGGSGGAGDMSYFNPLDGGSRDASKSLGPQILPSIADAATTAGEARYACAFGLPILPL